MNRHQYWSSSIQNDREAKKDETHTKTPPDAVPGTVAEGNDSTPSVREFARLRYAARDDPAFGLEDVSVFAPHFGVDVHSGKRNMEDLSTAKND